MFVKTGGNEKSMKDRIDAFAETLLFAKTKIFIQ
jgi:hypothetical protein